MKASVSETREEILLFSIAAANSGVKAKHSIKLQALALQSIVP